MNETKQTQAQAAQAYTKKLHRIGTTTMLLLFVLTFIPPFYVFWKFDVFPGWATLTGILGALSANEVATWILEPVIYFPMVGIAGSYICFSAGNITNERIPCALAAQSAVDAKRGSLKAEVAGVYGMVASVVVNFILLAIVIFFGSYLMNILPESVKLAFNYALPAVYGTSIVVLLNMFGFGSKSKK